MILMMISMIMMMKILILMLNNLVIMMTMMKIPSWSDLKIMVMMMVSASDVLDHLNDLRLAMSEIKRILKPNGLLVFDTINRTWESYLIFYLIAQGSLSCNVTTSNYSYYCFHYYCYFHYYYFYY